MGKAFRLLQQPDRVRARSIPPGPVVWSSCSMSQGEPYQSAQRAGRSGEDPQAAIGAGGVVLVQQVVRLEPHGHAIRQGVIDRGLDLPVGGKLNAASSVLKA